MRQPFAIPGSFESRAELIRCALSARAELLTLLLSSP